MMKRLTPLLALLFAIPLHAQTWFPVAHDLDSISIPAGTVTRYGAKAGTPWGCGTQIKPLAEDAWVTPTKLGSVVSPPSLGVSDPANCYVKELDVAETVSVQAVTVNGVAKQVPALPVVVVVPPVPVAQTLTCTVTVPSFPVTYTPGAPASTLTAAIASSFNAVLSGLTVACK